MLTLNKKEIHLWLTSEQEVPAGELTDRYQALLNEEEQRRYRRFVFEEHRHRFLVTRALVRSVLGQYKYTDSAENISFEHNGHGKPRLRNAGTGLHFNVSHARGLIALAVVLEYEIGVDVESVIRKTDIDKLAERYFSPQEFRSMEDFNAKQRNERFFDLWTLKESYIKACGQGLTIPLEEFSFSFEGKAIHIAFSPQRNDNPGRWSFWLLNPGGDYRLALAVSGEKPSDFTLICHRGIPLQDFVKTRLDVLGTTP
ncbi:MAG: 4'-phosphopantetheinyl transferase superfamily protein [Pseudohongiellaceae bacterium]